MKEKIRHNPCSQIDKRAIISSQGDRCIAVFWIAFYTHDGEGAAMLYDNILVPYDGSASADAALEEAARYAKEDPGCALHVLQISDIEHQVIERLDSSYGAAVPVGMREA